MSDPIYKDHALLSTAYLPPVDYFRAIVAYGGCAIERFENYQKQSHRNRCHIYSANGAIPLIVPVIRAEKGRQCTDSSNEQHSLQYKQLITDVKIDYSKQWQKQHWKAIHSAYKSTPFFDYYQDDIYPFFSSIKEERLFDLNSKLMSVILNILELPTELICTQSYCEEHPIDFRNLIHPKKGSPLNLKLSENENDTLSGYDSDKITTCDRNNITPINNCSAKKYHQIFAHKYGFIENLSIIDLIFNEGPEAALYL